MAPKNNQIELIDLPFNLQGFFLHSKYVYVMSYVTVFVCIYIKRHPQ